MIRQVTDNHHHRHHPGRSSANHRLLGTTTELHFKSFMEEYEKSYSTHEEYVHRLGIFAKNLIKAAEHQAMDPSAIHGVTQFSDLTEEEFEATYMGLKGGAGVGGTTQLGKDDGDESAAEVMMDVSDLPESFDWREKGAVTEVKTQVILDSYYSTVGQSIFLSLLLHLLYYLLMCINRDHLRGMWKQC